MVNTNVFYFDPKDRKGVVLKKLILSIVTGVCVSATAQTNTESLQDGINETSERIATPMPQSPDVSQAPRKNMRLDLTIYRDEQNVQASSGKTRSSVNTFEIQPKYNITPQMYLMATFQQIEGEENSNPAVGARSKTEISGFMEPMLEWAYKTQGDLRYYGGAMYRFDTGTAKSTDQVISPKKGGQALEPILGLEIDLPGYLFGAEYRYTIEGTRRQQGADGLTKTLTEGNRNLFYSFIEQTTKYGPGVGLAYFQKDRSAVKGADKAPGYTRLYGELYLQIPVYQDTTLIPLLSYSKNLETRVQGESIRRNENYNLTVTGRATF